MNRREMLRQGLRNLAQRLPAFMAPGGGLGVLLNRNLAGSEAPPGPVASFPTPGPPATPDPNKASKEEE